MLYEYLREPTADECDRNVEMSRRDGRVGFAAWYPQMGGYCGKAVVLVIDEEVHTDCFDVLVWHDGDFPFSDGKPVELHHCSPDQFIQFGTRVKELMSLSRDGTSTSGG